MFKSDFVKKFKRIKIDAIIIIDNNNNQILAIVKNEYDKEDLDRSGVG